MKWLAIAGISLAGLVALVTLIGLLLPTAHVAARSAHVNRSREAVWKLISGDQSWRPDIRHYEPLPDRGGLRAWKETDSHGKSITFEQTESREAQRLVTRIADTGLPFGGSWTYELEDEAGGCTIRITEHGEVYNPIFRFVSRFILGHAATIEAYLRALSQRLEQGA